MPNAATRPSYGLIAKLDKGFRILSTKLFPRTSFSFPVSSLESEIKAEGLDTLIGTSTCFPATEVNKFASFTALFMHGLVAKHRPTNSTMIHQYEEDANGRFAWNKSEQKPLQLKLYVVEKTEHDTQTLRDDELMLHTEIKDGLGRVSVLGPFIGKLTELERAATQLEETSRADVCRELKLKVARKITRAVYTYVAKAGNAASEAIKAQNDPPRLNLAENGDVEQTDGNKVNFTEGSAAIVNAQTKLVTRGAHVFEWPSAGMSSHGERS